jgi:endonuclease YncB( thermonuclease family)
MNGRCPYETALAAEATERLEALLNEGPFELHRLPSGRGEDQYGRKLRIATRDGQTVGVVLVAEGLARTWGAGGRGGAADGASPLGHEISLEVSSRI